MSVRGSAIEALRASPVVEGIAKGGAQPWSPELVKFLTISILVFVGAAILVTAALYWRAGTAHQNILKAFGLLTIVGLSAVLVIVGFSTEQLTPVIGLFGAIAGYLLGKDSRTDTGER
jgi:hypothetical protein